MTENFQGEGAHVTPCRVVKVGGRELRPGRDLETFVAWVRDAVREGAPLLIVHGGGEEVSRLSERLGIAPEKVDGQRVTTPEVLPLVEGVLAGPVNLRLVSALVQEGVRAVGLSGVSAGLLVAQPVADGRLGLVGEPSRVDTSLVELLLRAGTVPVLAPLASDGEGGVLNVNADLFAAGFAQALGADLLLFTDVPGVLGRTGRLIPSLTPLQAEELVADGTVHDGMLPKVEGALSVLAHGAHRVWIGSLGESRSGALRSGTWFVPETSTPEAPSASSLPLLPLPSGVGGL